MTSELQQQAGKLSDRPYSVEILHDETTTGEPVVVVSHPELPGCMAQGKNLEEALHELEQARFEYILSLLEDNLPVPGPLDRKVGTGMTTSGTQGTSWRVNQTVVVNQEIESLPRSNSESENQGRPTIISVVRR
jgi:predicted RNase H-like HicB family nuclease